MLIETSQSLIYPTFDFETLSDEELQDKVNQEIERVKQDEGWQLARSMFVQDDKPFEMSPGETTIFNLITRREYPLSQIIASTQWGKTETIARAVLTRITTFPEDWLIITPDTKRGKILLNYIIKDTSENDYFKRKLVGISLEDRTVLNRLLEERSKLKLTYQVIGEDNKIRYGSVEILTAEARRKRDTINSILGFGGRNLIADESSLVDNDIDAGVFRMLAGKGDDIFLCKIGNPFYRNHFLTTWQDPDYKKIFINDRIGLAEGRYTKWFLDKAKKKPKYSILFECKFPEEGMIDEGNWSPLFTEREIESAFTDSFSPFGFPMLGADPADTGDNESVIVNRWENVAKIAFADNKIEPLEFCGKIDGVINNYKIDCRNCSVDRIGVGAMIPAKMRELAKSIEGVNVAESCEKEDDKKLFINKRAEFAWKTKQWISQGGKLYVENIEQTIADKSHRWYQLLNIKYKYDNKRRMKLMSKDDMRKEGLDSPDAFDALCLTLARRTMTDKKSTFDIRFEKSMREKLKKKKVGEFRMRGY